MFNAQQMNMEETHVVTPNMQKPDAPTKPNWGHST